MWMARLKVSDTGYCRPNARISAQRRSRRACGRDTEAANGVRQCEPDNDCTSPYSRVGAGTFAVAGNGDARELGPRLRRD